VIGGYRFGFNGKEKDLETTGTSTYDYGFRIYNPALGRFLSVDPLAKEYPWNSSYAFAENSPIEYVDLDGLEKFKIMMNLFIPFKTIPIAPVPPPVSGTVTVKGDNRNLDASGTSPHNRVSVSFDIDVDNPASNQFQTNVTIGETKYFLETPFLPDMTLWSGRAELGKEVNVNFTRSVTTTATEITTTVNYSIECKIPFPLRDVKYLDGINPAPAIDGSGSFTFTKNIKTGEVLFNQTHNVDGFPANEYVAKNLNNNTTTPLLLFQPDDKMDAINLLPKVGDKTFESKNKTLATGNSGKPIWTGAIPIMENDTKQKATPPLTPPAQSSPLQVDKKPGS
jgi:RHS repeat-associated protein